MEEKEHTKIENETTIFTWDGKCFFLQFRFYYGVFTKELYGYVIL